MKNIVLFGCFALLLMSFSIIKKHGSYNPISREKIIDTVFVCLPCGYGCDNLVYKESGFCAQCNMPLVNKATIFFKNIEPAEICSFIKKRGKQKVVLLDVRTNEEFTGNAPDKFGRLDGAINIPVQELASRIKELNQYKNKDILVYCIHPLLLCCSIHSCRKAYLLLY